MRVNVAGGGPNGQAGAVRHGIARALLKFDDANLRPALKAEGLLTRDPRMRSARNTASRARANASSTPNVNRAGNFQAPLVQSGGVFCFGRDRRVAVTVMKIWVADMATLPVRFEI